MISVRAFALLAAVLPLSASAQDQVTIRVGYSPGGSYDAMARLVADHLGKFVEGAPTIVVSNEPGAGSKKLAKLFYASGATDGSEIAVISSALALNPIFSPDDKDYDPTQAHYLAAMSNEASYCVTSKSSGITTMEQLLTGNYKVGATGKDSTTYVFPAAIKAALDAKFEIVVGFEGGSEIDLAMERGELDARCGIGLTSLQQGDYMDRVNIIGELAVAPTDEIDGIEFVPDLVTDPRAREALELVLSANLIHHPFVAAPGTPPETVTALREAFIEMAADPAFQADAEARRVHVGMTPGATVETMIEGFIAKPDDIKALARDYTQ